MERFRSSVNREVRGRWLLALLAATSACTDDFTVGDAGMDAQQTRDDGTDTRTDAPRTDVRAADGAPDIAAPVGGPLLETSSCEDYPATTTYLATFADGEQTRLFIDRGDASIEDGLLRVDPGETAFGTPIVLVQLRDRFARLAVCADIADSGASGRLSIAAKQFADGATCVVDRDEQLLRLASVASGLLDVTPIPWLRPGSALRIGATHEGDAVRCEVLDVETGDYAQLEGTLIEPLTDVGLELIASGEGVTIDTLSAGLPR
ncbi:MAG: hypothetical protein AAF411_01310 [Myxococcota bacterium]